MITATSSDVGALAVRTTMKTTKVRIAPKPLIASLRRQPGDRSLSQWRTMPALADREGDEHADRVERDQRRHDAAEHDDQMQSPRRSG